MNKPLLLLLCCALLIFGCDATGAPTVPSGFTIERIAGVPGARALAFAPDGTLFAGTTGGDVYILPRAGFAAGTAQARVFAHFDDAPAAGVAFANGTLYVGTEHAIWSLAYRSGEAHPASAPHKLAAVRTGSPPAGSDGDVHTTTSVAAFGDDVYASVGSSCNACVETDSTRERSDACAADATTRSRKNATATRSR